MTTASTALHLLRASRGGLLQREVTRREAQIRAWWQVTGEGVQDATQVNE